MKLVSMGMNVSINCSFCRNMPESTEHLYFQCSCINRIWVAVMGKMQRRNVSQDNAVEWGRIYTNAGNKKESERAFSVVLKSFISSVWRERNNRLFNPSNAKTDVNFKRWIMEEIRDSLRQLTFAIDPGLSAAFVRI